LNNSNNNFNDIFPSINKEDWLKKIHIDLKGKDLSEMLWNPFGDHSISPAIHRDDVTNSLNVDMDRSELNKIPTGFIQNDSPEKMRERVFQLLEYGVGRLVFTTSENQNDQIDHILTDVDRSLVGIHIQPKITQIAFDNTRHWLSTAAIALQTAKNNDDVIQLNYSDDFYFNLCATRAIKLALQEREENQRPKLISNYSFKEGNDIATQLLHCMPIHLAGLLAGVDGLSHSGCHQIDHDRLLINNCHLLILESGIPLNIDTIQGSFYLDYATQIFKSELQEKLTPKSAQS